MPTQTLSAAPAGPQGPTDAVPSLGPIAASPVFKSEFNRHPFLFNHTLADHPLFTLPRLKQLALETRTKRPQELYYDAGHNVAIGAKWNELERPPLEEAFDRIETAGSWITIHQAQLDPEYGVVFNECMRQFESFTGLDFKKMMRVEDALIFITSPNRTTTYHIDRECNFLLQIRGEKTIYLFDQRDKEVVPETELETFWAVDKNAGTYKPEFQGRANPMRLVPGNGVHIPINDPHWLQNDNNVSVSLSVNFTLKDSERANIYRANYFLRKAGLKPSPPFTSPVTDGLKNAMMNASYVPARSAIRTLRRLRGQETRTS